MWNFEDILSANLNSQRASKSGELFFGGSGELCYFFLLQSHYLDLNLGTVHPAFSFFPPW